MKMLAFQRRVPQILYRGICILENQCIAHHYNFVSWSWVWKIIKKKKDNSQRLHSVYMYVAVYKLRNAESLNPQVLLMCMLWSEWLYKH